MVLCWVLWFPELYGCLWGRTVGSNKEQSSYTVPQRSPVHFCQARIFPQQPSLGMQVSKSTLISSLQGLALQGLRVQRLGLRVRFFLWSRVEGPSVQGLSVLRFGWI